MAWNRPCSHCKRNYFEDRFLAFDREAAIAFALLASRAAAKGYSISVADCQIAAIAAVHGFAVATRDTAPFQAAGVPVINPWKIEETCNEVCSKAPLNPDPVLYPDPCFSS